MAYGDRGAWKRVGADGLMERARSMSPSVKMSAANLGGASALVLSFGYSIRHCDVPEDCVTIDTGVLEVNSRRAISTNNNLQLERQRMSLYVLHRI